MEKMFTEFLTELLSKAPEVLITLGVVYLIVFLLREYRKVRQETEQSIKDVVNSRLGEYMSKIQSEISRMDIASRDQEAKLKTMNQNYEQFTSALDEKTETINELYAEAQEKLLSLREAIPNVDEYSARDLLGIAERKDNPQARAEICKRILTHQDSGSIELEVAGDMMRKNNRYQLALQLYEKSHQIDPERTSAHIEMLSLQATLEFQNRNKVLEEAKNLLLTKPDRAGFASVANALIHLDRYQELMDFSKVFIERIKNRNPQLKALALRNLAVAYREIGDITASIGTYEEAFNVAPGDENTLKPYLSLLEEQGHEQEYKEVARKLISIDPSDITYYQFYIDSLIKAGDVEEASSWFNKAMKLPKSQMDEARLHSVGIKIRAAANISGGGHQDHDARPCDPRDAQQAARP